MRGLLKPYLPFVILLLAGGLLLAADTVKLDPLPVPLTGNAVVSVKSHGEFTLYSFMGIGAKKSWDEATNDAYLLDPETGKWHLPRPVPGTAGRINATAVYARDHIFVFGGTIVTAQGRELTVPDVNVYEPDTDRWFRGPDIPVAVDYAVSGVYRNRYIYLVGGRAKGFAVDKVQVYDAEKDKWMDGTPLPGGPVFGHAGAIVDDTILYVDGATNNTAAKPPYVALDQCWMGKIDHHDPAKIQWTKISSHPGDARFGIAAGGSDKDDRVYFSGGAAKPYSYTGMGYDGTPAEPSPTTFAYNLHSGKWEVINATTPDSTMGNHGLLVTSQSLVLIGGMQKGQKVTAKVAVLSKEPPAK